MENTKFSFEYWTEGETYPWYYAYYYSVFADQKYGDELQLMVLICLGFCFLLYFCCFINCICQKCCKKKPQENAVRSHDDQQLIEFTK